MNDRIAKLAALNSFYQSGHDLIGVLGDYILKFLLLDRNIPISDIQNLVKDELDILIPEDVLRTSIRRLKDNNFVIYEEIKKFYSSMVRLKDSGRERQIDVQNNFKEAEREKSALIGSLSEFIKKEVGSFDLKTIENNLFVFIEENYFQAVSLLENHRKNNDQEKNELQAGIAKYFLFVEESDPINYDRLKKVLYGKIISCALLKKNFDPKAKFGHLSVYLDTNIVFSIMGFHEDDLCKATKEIFELIKEAGLKSKVFSFTKDEIASKLRGYLQDYGRYSSQIKVDSIYHILKRKGYSKLAVISIIENIESKLEELGIEIDYSFDVENILAENQKFISRFDQFGLEKPSISKKRDIASIFAIRKIRGDKNHFLFEKSQAVFLTADVPLSSFDFNALNHKDLLTFPEVLFRGEFASLMWLKNRRGGDSAVFHNFLANYAREGLIRRRLWEKFIQEIEKRKSENLLSDEDIDDIMAYEETEQILRKEKEGGIKIILDDDNIRKKREQRIIEKRETQKRESEFKNRIEELSENNKNIEKDSRDTKKENIKKIEDLESRLAIFEKIAMSIQGKCQKKWSILINLSIVIAGIFFVAMIFYIIINFGIDVVNSIGGIILLVIAAIIICIGLILGKKFDAKDWIIEKRNGLENKLITKCLKRKKKKIGF